MKISVCVPTHKILESGFFLDRLLKSLEEQTFSDFELVMTEEGKMAENTNAAIKKAKGDIIKILFMDDYLAHPDSLQVIADRFTGGWLATRCDHDEDGITNNIHRPQWNRDMRDGRNTIGSPSVIAFENKEPLLFDEKMSWLLDVDLYYRLGQRYGPPTLVDDINVVIGLGDHQTTNTLSDEAKLAEHIYLTQKYS